MISSWFFQGFLLGFRPGFLEEFLPDFFHSYLPKFHHLFFTGFFKGFLAFIHLFIEFIFLRVPDISPGISSVILSSGNCFRGFPETYSGMLSGMLLSQDSCMDFYGIFPRILSVISPGIHSLTFPEFSLGSFPNIPSRFCQDLSKNSRACAPFFSLCHHVHPIPKNRQFKHQLFLFFFLSYILTPN